MISYRILSIILFCGFLQAAIAERPRVEPLPWVAIDGLGRRIDRAPDSRQDKFVGVFYYIWHGSHGYDISFNPTAESGQGTAPKARDHYKSPYVISEILAQDPEEREWGPVNTFHHWGEPLWGFYLADDEWPIGC